MNIVFINGKLKGQFLKGNIQSFTGIIDRNCKGAMKIPDIGLKNFAYGEKEYTIF